MYCTSPLTTGPGMKTIPNTETEYTAISAMSGARISRMTMNETRDISTDGATIATVYCLRCKVKVLQAGHQRFGNQYDRRYDVGQQGPAGKGNDTGHDVRRQSGFGNMHDDGPVGRRRD